EQSGHIIFLDDARTGDGILAALRLLDVLESSTLDLDGEASVMKSYPQLLKNVPIREKRPLETWTAVQAAVQSARTRLGEEGRVALRYWAPGPLLREMLGGRDQGSGETLPDSFWEAFRSSFGT